MRVLVSRRRRNARRLLGLHLVAQTHLLVLVLYILCHMVCWQQMAFRCYQAAALHSGSEVSGGRALHLCYVGVELLLGSAVWVRAVHHVG